LLKSHPDLLIRAQNTFAVGEQDLPGSLACRRSLAVDSHNMDAERFDNSNATADLFTSETLKSFTAAH
jgi:hypothetical protein